MKKRLGLFLVILFAAVVLPGSIIFAHAADETTTTNNDTTTSDDSSNGSSTPPSSGSGETQSKDEYEVEDKEATDYQKNLEARLEKRKEMLKEKLTYSQKKRITKRCIAAQKIITTVADKAKEAKTNRDKIYTNILSKTTDLRDKLKQQGQDTTKLDKNITELESLVNTFKSSLKDLRQSAVDMTNMDCAADPSGFKASLEAFRTDRETVLKNSLAIRTYINDSLKPTLKEIHDTLGGTSQEGSN